jgi:capsular polysaccharide biosynthesis protein
MTYKAVLVACARWETSCIMEWLTYNRWLGFDHVHLYCNDDDPAELYEAVLPFTIGPDPYVTFHYYPYLGQQKQMYLHYLRNYKAETEWFSFLDVDEFLRLPVHKTIGNFIDDYGKRADGIYLNWCFFGNSGFDERPPGSVLINYTRRSAASHNPMTKVITRSAAIDPARVAIGPRSDFWHYWDSYQDFRQLRLINVLGEPMHGYYDDIEKSAAHVRRPEIYQALMDTAIINHYAYKSRQDFIRRTRRGTLGSFEQHVAYEKHYHSGYMDKLLIEMNEVEDTFLHELWRGVIAGGAATAVFPGVTRLAEFLTTAVMLRTADAASLATPVAPAAFAAGRDVTAVIHPAASTAITPPKFLNAPATGPKLTGPHFLLPDFQRPKHVPTRVESPALSLTCLSDVLCLPGQIALAHVNGAPVLLTESLSDPWTRHNVTLTKHGETTFSLQKDPPVPTPLPGRYLYLDNMHAPHFGHFMADVLSMAWGYRAAQSLGATDLRVLIAGGDPEYATPLLTAAGIPADAITRITAPVRCETLIVASRAYQLQGWTSPTATATWARIRDALDQGSGPERVYFTRRAVGNRVLANEEAVEALFRSRGFTIIAPETLPIRQQVTLWANAKLVAGTAGSNMFGLAFQRNLRASFIITSPNMVQFQEAFLQAGHDSEMTVYLGHATDTEVHSPWTIDPGDLALAFDAWLAPHNRAALAPAIRPAPPAARPAPAPIANIARGKPATQSSVSPFSRRPTPAQDAAGAVDGTPNGTAKFHTELERDPWWRVDLGHASEITEIRVYNRSDDTQLGRLKHLTLAVSNDDISWRDVARKTDDTIVGGIHSAPYSFTPRGKIIARYVRVLAPGRTYLHLDQVEVYGRPLP